MAHICSACKHYRLQRLVRMIAPGSAGSPGQAEAALEEMRLEKQWQDVERVRFENPDYRFDYEPKFYAWCARFTPSAARLAKVKERIYDGADPDEVRAEELREGFDFMFEPATGEVIPVYVLCKRRNQASYCPDGFEPRSASAPR